MNFNYLYFLFCIIPIFYFCFKNNQTNSYYDNLSVDSNYLTAIVSEDYYAVPINE